MEYQSNAVNTAEPITIGPNTKGIIFKNTCSIGLQYAAIIAMGDVHS
jgi:succinyl-CoA synthetase alpha subunit